MHLVCPTFITQFHRVGKWQTFNVVVVVLMCWWAEMISLRRHWCSSAAQKMWSWNAGNAKADSRQVSQTSKQINYPLDNILKRLVCIPLFFTLCILYVLSSNQLEMMHCHICNLPILKGFVYFSFEIIDTVIFCLELALKVGNSAFDFLARIRMNFGANLSYFIHECKLGS